MRDRRRKIIDDKSHSLGSKLPELSLFVIMLAFFIVLNSISIIKDERARPLMESVEQAFATKIIPQENMLPSSSALSDEEVSGEGRIVERLEGLFAERIAGVQMQKDEMTGALLVRMEYEDFTTALNSLQTDDPDAGFLRVLVSMMRSDSAGYPYRMDAFFQVKDNPARMQNQQPQKIQALMREWGAMAQKLEDAGLPSKLVTVGVEQGQEGMVELLFRPHIPYNPMRESGTEDE